MPRLVKDWRSRLALELRTARRLFVLGVGNPGRADDGVGSLCARLLQQSLARSSFFECHGELPAGAPASWGHFSTRSCQSDSRRDLSANDGRDGRSDQDTQKREEIGILDAGEVPESSTGLVREFGPTHVLIIDAASAGHEPGTIFFIDKKKIAREDMTTHQIPLSHLVRYLETTVGCRAILLGIEPGNTSRGRPMSRTVRGAARILAGAIGEALLEKCITGPA